MPLCPGLPGWACIRKVKPIWISLKQETVSGSGISWAICKYAPRSRQITMPATHHSVFLQAVCPSCRPTNSVKALKAISTEVEQCLEKNKHPQGSRTRRSHLCFILSWFLRDFAPYVCEPLAAIFNASIREGSVLQIWKAAEVPITSQYQKSPDRGT